jgi:hypothetical protein
MSLRNALLKPVWRNVMWSPRYGWKVSEGGQQGAAQDGVRKYVHNADCEVCADAPQLPLSNAAIRALVAGLPVEIWPETQPQERNS